MSRCRPLVELPDGSWPGGPGAGVPGRVAPGDYSPWTETGDAIGFTAAKLFVQRSQKDGNRDAISIGADPPF
jgi:hypothetical protein